MGSKKKIRGGSPVRNSKATKVLFLGAGASRSAGYPVAEDLLPKIKADAFSGADETLRKAWLVWEDTKEKAPGALRLLLQDPNPEVALSVLDLCSASRSAGIELKVPAEKRDDLVSAALSGEEIPASSFTSPDYQWIDQAETARYRLLNCLTAFFEYMHQRDAESSSEKRMYLRKEIEKLKPGDTVITTNWDTLSERILCEEGLWTPRDGYGFARNLLGEFRQPLSGKLAEPSKIKVLKLHGSVGWYRRFGEVYMTNEFLQGFPCDETILDPTALELAPEPDYQPVIAYPTFLKKLDLAVVLDIWQQADAALRSATQVEIWGYSLPESDGAIRILLNALRVQPETTKKDTSRIAIHVPFCDVQSRKTRDRWRQFLPEANVDKEKLG